MGDVIPIINRNFYKHVDSVLEQHAKSCLRIQQEFILTDNLLQGIRPDYLSIIDLSDNKENIAANNVDDAPIEQIEWVQAHDDLIEAMDRLLLPLSYFIKIQNFIPDIIKHFGPTYHYSQSISNGKTQTQDIDLTALQSSGKIKEDIQSIVDAIFSYVHRIRDKFSQSTRDAITGTNNQDPFSVKFYQGQLLEQEQVGGRMEYIFFDKYDIPLGEFYAHDHIQKWIQRQMFDAGIHNSLYQNIKSSKLSDKFPAIIAPSVKKNHILTTRARHTYATGLYGAIPKSGIIIGDAEKKPLRTQPRLVR